MLGPRLLHRARKGRSIPSLRVSVSPRVEKVRIPFPLIRIPLPLTPEGRDDGQLTDHWPPAESSVDVFP